MNITFASTFDAHDVQQWSGTPYFMLQQFQRDNVHIDYVGPLKTELPVSFKWRQVCKRILGQQRDSGRFNIDVARSYARQIQTQLNPATDVILSTQVPPLAFLETDKPIVLWTDALFTSLLGFYSPSSTLSADTILQANQLTERFLARCRYAIFSSDWAADDAIYKFGVARDKVKVVPFGANIDNSLPLAEVREIIKRRSKSVIKLLFLGREWERKGGDKVLAVATKLHESGQHVELTIVGCNPTIPTLPFVKCLGFISKNTAEGKNRIQQLLAESHFLFVPSRAEAYGIVFCEANAFGLPCLTTYVGGISTIVKDDINGKTFAVDASAKEYCEYITRLFERYDLYEALALSAFNEFESRLNWRVATKAMKQLLLQR